MNNLRRWLSGLLAIVMVAALLCVPSLAAEKNEFGIESYVALGDSIATGLNDNTGTNQDAYGSWENGYTVKLAEKLGLLDGAETYIPKDYNYLYYTSPNDSGSTPGLSPPCARGRSCTRWTRPTSMRKTILPICGWTTTSWTSLSATWAR